MIKLVFPTPDPADEQLWRRWRRDCETETNTHIRWREDGEGEPREIKRDLYGRKSIKKRYYHDGKGECFAPFFSKCVYCETRKTVLHVEHFRPKLAVTDEDGQHIARSHPDAEDERHPGYYWLAYDWQNLLIACDDCNVGYKRDKFPLANEDDRVWASTGDLSAEKPLLVNPVNDDPSEHLDVDMDTGMLMPKTARGKVTIDVLGLNRNQLPEQRRRMITYIKNKWAQVFEIDIPPEQRDSALEYIKKSRKGHFEFTLTARVTLATLYEHTLAAIRETSTP